MAGTPQQDTLARIRQLEKLPKYELAAMHRRNGGIMKMAEYLKWRHEELVRAVAEDEGIDVFAPQNLNPGAQ